MLMIERVARALSLHRDGAEIWWQDYVSDARAAILAMREPTEGMISDMQDTIRFISDGWFPADGVVTVWTDGIDAVLHDE